MDFVKNAKTHIYLIDMMIMHQDKALDGGYWAFCAHTREMAESLIRKSLILYKKSLEEQIKNPKVVISATYDGDLTSKGKCRVYYTDNDKKRYYAEFRILEFPLLERLEDVNYDLVKAVVKRRK